MSTQNASVCGFKTSPCVPAPRAHVFQHMCACCRCTRGRFERTHGGVLSGHTGFFSVPHRTLHHDHVHNQQPHTNKHAHPTHNTHQQHTPTHTETHSQQHTTHRDTHHITRRQTETKKTEREEKTKEKIRPDKMKEKMKEKKTEIMMWTDAESKFTQEKAKLAKLKYTRN